MLSGEEAFDARAQPISGRGDPGGVAGGVLFGGGVGEHAQTAAFVDGTTGVSVSFGELHAQVLRIAAALAQRGIGRGDVVALYAPNSPSWAAVFHGILRANAVVTRSMCSTPRTSWRPSLPTRGPGCWSPPPRCWIGPWPRRKRSGSRRRRLVVLDAADGHPSLADLLGCTGDPPACVVGADDLAVLPYSSGTSGRPKGVILTHRNLVANLAQLRAVTLVEPGARVLAVLPFFHIFGMTCLVNHGIDRRVSVVTLPRFDLDQFLRVIAEYRVQRVGIVPPIAVALAKHPAVGSYDLSCLELVFSGAAPLDAAIGAAVARRLGCRMVQGFGMTEMSPVSHCVPDGSTWTSPPSARWCRTWRR